MALVQVDKLVRIILTVGDNGNITSANTESVRQIVDDQTGAVMASSAYAGGFDPADPRINGVLGKVTANVLSQVNNLQGQLDSVASERDALKKRLGL